MKASGDLKVRLCTRCGLEIRVNLEDRISGLEKDLETERKDRMKLQLEFHELCSEMVKAVASIEKLTEIALQSKEDHNKLIESMNTHLRWHKSEEKTLEFCTCQQLASQEVNGKHICIVCFRIVEDFRIKNEQAADEACKTANQENSEMPEIIQPRDQEEEEQLHMIRPGVYAKGSCEGGSCDG